MDDRFLIVTLTIIAIVAIVAIFGAQLTGMGVAGRGNWGTNGRWAGDWCKITTPQGKEVYAPCQVAESQPEQAAPAVCGDGVCESDLEDAVSCPDDCLVTCWCDRTRFCDRGCRCDPDCFIVIGGI